MQLSNKNYQNLITSLELDLELEEVEPGALIYSTNNSPGKIVFIEKGQLRLIDEKRTFGSLTLLKSDAPFVLGLSQLNSLPIAEEARASSLCSYGVISLEDLPEKSVSILNDLLRNSIDPFELPTVKSLLQDSNKYFNPDHDNPNLLMNDLNIVKSAEEIRSTGILFYLDQESDGFQYGQSLTPEIFRTYFNSQSLPRIGIVHTQEILQTNRHLPKPVEKVIEQEPNQPEAPINDSMPTTLELDNDVRKQEVFDFNLIRANNRRDAFVACLSMLVEHFELPTRRDTINRAANILDEDDIRWGRKLLSILDNFGLAVRNIRIHPDRPLRLPVPCIWIDSQGLCSIIVNTTNREIIILNPLKGVEKLRTSEASERLSDNPEVISVALGLHTPKKRFNVLWLLPYMKRYRLQLIEVFAASFLNQLFALATPLLFQQIIDRVISKGAFDALTPLVVLMMIFVILETIFSSLRTFQFVEVSNRIDIGVGSAIVSRLLRINARFFDRRPVGELSSRLGELDNIRRFLTGTALTAVLDAIFSVLYFAVMFFYSPLLTLTVLLTIPFLFIVTVGITPITQRLIRRRAEAASRTHSLLVEILSGIQTVKLQNAELTARRQWEDRHLESINQGFKAVLANTTSSNALQLISKVSNIIIIGLGAWLVLRNELTLGQLIAFRIISGYVTQPMLRLASTWQSFQEMSLSLERVGDVVNQPLEISENEEGNIIIPPIKGRIVADAVGFAYSSSSTPVLSSVSLEIEAGTFVGLVGQSGCGKSSFLKMVPRLYIPTQGRILIDGFDIAKVDLYSLRKQLGFVPQDCMLFEGTVFSNIALGDPQAESERVLAMSKIACAHEFIMTLPYGYNTPIGEKGAGLSGGQRQRISLARMLLEDPNMVILDEATSALDVDTEKQVVSNLRAHFKNKTMLMITHRLSTLVDADQIIVMHDGRIDSIGNHKELMKKKGRYFALYQSQFGEPE
ncbi:MULTISPECIES: peptidase domain-containing ABC transporter [Prochlorococcus]|uniref:peptidase domain-containing ABC transporter n=1 Tax=Prochlorococcus TaxID=1218 RepID=UPI0007B31C32|nr:MULTISPECIES: peptidase domain-containing ABC transporter [Prochlorococcus]KZR63601.1 Toxin RTX-I translocation ATP-binding protein [Prochlorococcus marinus str. MIT 1312]KZR78755.1 Toxin RTX-I translocation ATP-binding protein [Prochlorococcus marinus str. MIT 1327]NMO84434.1 peptidase domain-containing ABC transporter [Prochlorococcus sp. P1344]NMP06258.1 peptidase domain-containing ABC transporter [Prochlorococcus sp. P1361]